jgi:hypothetical protein
MASGLELWLQQATRHLSRDSAAQVRTEIQQHYESGLEDALNAGASAGDADRRALNGLGDARKANRQYREVLLTSADARMLREGNWEAQAFCSHGSVRIVLAAIPALALIAAAVLFLTGASEPARIVLAGGIGSGLLFVTPLLPVYTPSRGRVARFVKWAALVCMLVLVFGPDALRLSWLLFASLWPMVWIEWTRHSIRRKLPVARWPKQLYL